MAELFQWWNLVYVLAFFLALLYALLNAVGLATSEAGADVGMDHDIDADVDAHVDLDHDVDFDHDVSFDHDVDVDAGVDIDHDVDVHVDVDHDVDLDHDVHLDHDLHAELSLLEEALSFFGIGKVPLSVILMTFLITFAIVGWAVNTVLKDVVITPLIFFPISCASAIFCGLAGTKVLASTLGRYLKPVETAAVRRASLVGRIATARLPVTDSFGQATVEDQYGTRHKVVCKVPEGAEPVPRGQSVLLVRFVPDRRRDRRTDGYYLVEPYEVPRHKPPRKE